MVTREISLSSGHVLKATPVLDTYWKFAAERQKIFMDRVEGLPPPWTHDPILSKHKFTNAYRASDRVSQYLLRHVIYEGEQTGEEIFFRTLLFKFFNRVNTWEELRARLGDLRWSSFNLDEYSRVLDAMMSRGDKVYSAAYIMPSPALGETRKHRNHLSLLDRMVKQGLPAQLERAPSLQKVFELLLNCPSLGDFLAFQFAIDLNYSSMLDFSEMDFVVAGPGARDGIRKCFADTAGLNEAEVIRAVTELAEGEFARLGLEFRTLWGRPLQLIDCQNLFCETDKYARVAHPEFSGDSGRTRIKQVFSPNSNPSPQWYPPKWGLEVPQFDEVDDLVFPWM